MSRLKTFAYMVIAGVGYVLLDQSVVSVKALGSSVIFGGGALFLHWLANLPGRK